MSSQLPTDSNDAKQTLEIVWNLHGDQLRRRARTRLRQYGLTGQTESMDICNDVMADLARRGPRPTTPDEILAYILRAIDNQVLDTFRKLASQCRDFRRNEAAPVEELRISAEMTTPSQISIRREIMDRLRASLPAEEVLAVDMMLENRDWHEIGDAIGMKPDAARMKVRRAIERIREQMARQTVDE